MCPKLLLLPAPIDEPSPPHTPRHEDPRGLGRGGRGTGGTYAHHRGAPPGFPTGNLERCCPSLNQEEPCLPAQNTRAHVSSDPGNNQSLEGVEGRYTGKKIHQKPQNTLGKSSILQFLPLNSEETTPMAPISSAVPQRAGYHPPGCWGRWHQGRKPRWNVQPADPNRTWSERILPVSSWRGRMRMEVSGSSAVIACWGHRSCLPGGQFTSQDRWH